LNFTVPLAGYNLSATRLCFDKNQAMDKS